MLPKHLNGLRANDMSDETTVEISWHSEDIIKHDGGSKIVIHYLPSRH